ncbi:hypothetical protein A0U40_16020 [[Bacillus] sp. KCTC 13219]|nr:hypothetical protein A0U40_16020 [[Bacillus] sp. KCTC 13219]
MKIPKSFGEDIYEMTCESLEKNSGIYIRDEDFDPHTPLSSRQIKMFGLTIATTAITYYHVALKEELLKHGIDIGNLEEF